ncbi:MAG: DUF58 domain-containing protein [Halieaceae bacterium]|nr:DUF58 domain-containing protein [Halieaceae bacterium]
MVKFQQQQPYGADIDSSPLIAARFSARFLDVTKASRALANLAGAKRSYRRGRGVEFDEVRKYTAGDDVRAIDWRVTARSGEPHTKLFHEERERPVLISLDLRHTMRFGSRNCFKSVLAAHTASLLLWSALDRGERVGGMVVSGNRAEDIRPARSRHTVLAIIREMVRCDKNNGDGEPLPLAEQLKQIQRIARPGSALFLISDFHDGLDPKVLQTLRRLVQHVQITGVMISDPLERNLPAAGHYVVSDASGRSALNTGNRKLVAQFSAEFDGHEQALREAYQGLRIPLIPISTDQLPLNVLQRYFPAH